MDNKKIAMELKRLRGNRSQKEVAEACGISVSALSMYEAGERIPRDDVKVMLARYFDESVASIFFN